MINRKLLCIGGVVSAVMWSIRFNWAWGSFWQAVAGSGRQWTGSGQLQSTSVKEWSTSLAMAMMHDHRKLRLVMLRLFSGCSH